jgi:hypothetical protein
MIRKLGIKYISKVYELVNNSFYLYTNEKSSDECFSGEKNLKEAMKYYKMLYS